MPLLVDLVYLIIAVLTAPIWLVSMIRTGKIRTDWPGRFGRAPRLQAPKPGKPRLLIHAVSVGEANAISALVARLAPDFEIVIAATTNTGFARAQSLYSRDHTVVRYPLDFSWAVRSFLNRIQPDLVALVELEVWPNFTRICTARRIPVVVINGRLSAHSFRGYTRLRMLVAPTFRSLAGIAAQDETIADRFAALGVDRHRIHVLGTMKWDNAIQTTDPHRKDQLQQQAQEIAHRWHLDRDRPIVVAGSTGPTEEALINQSVASDVQLIVAPRKPERFDEAARTLDPCIRRTQALNTDLPDPPGTTRFVLDTIGELAAVYTLADVVIVGRTFTNLHGSDMIEPVALGKPVIVGPDVSNFESVARALMDGGGVIQVTPDQLTATIADLLADPHRRSRIADAGSRVIAKNAGSVERHAQFLRDQLASKNNTAR